MSACNKIWDDYMSFYGSSWKEEELREEGVVEEEEQEEKAFWVSAAPFHPN